MAKQANAADLKPAPKGCRFDSDLAHQCPVLLTARISPSQGDDAGSIPAPGTRVSVR